MSSSKRFLVLAVALLTFVFPISAQSGGEIADRFCTGSNTTISSTYQTNLKKLLSSFTSINDNGFGPYGFYNISEGQGTDTVYGIALCRADMTRLRCQSCLLAASAYLNVTCSTEEGIVYYEYCVMRYSNRSIFSQLEESPSKVQNLDTQEEKNLRKFVSPLLDKLIDRAVLGNSTHKFAFGYNTSADLGNVYAFVQCTPDLTGELCGQCLKSMINVVRTSPTPSLGGKVLSPSCQVRYEAYRFYEVSVEQLLPFSPPKPGPTDYVPSKGQSSTRSRNIVVSVVSMVCLVVLTAWTLLFLKRRNQQKTLGTEEIQSVECVQYDFETIRAATKNFSDESKLGQGGFGAVYKGRLLDGRKIAVKRLAMTSGQGDIEFQNEVLLVAELQHRNLVKLLGFCLEGRERLLVYEFVPNASLDHFIYEKQAFLNWETRYKIIVGVAKGLLYLHEDSRTRIIHRDLKAGNILLDEDMNPKIADFGMAKLFELNQTQHETSRIVGTFGYMAPEYALDGHFSIKSDVYSFGVLVLEIISGQKNSTFGGEEASEYLISFAWKCWRAGTSQDLIDPALTDAPRDEIMRCIHIALLCVQDSAVMRPTMASVVLMLTSLSLPLPNPSEPAYFIQSKTATSSEQAHSSSLSHSSASQENSYNLLANDYSVTVIYPR